MGKKEKEYKQDELERYFSSITEFLQKEKDKGAYPGAVLAIINNDNIIYKKAVGKAQIDPEPRTMKVNTIFDLASLTKVVATTSAVMNLIEQGKISLYDYLKKYFPGIPEAKEEMTIYHLLTHTSGYQSGINLQDKKISYDEKI
ncbi:MAG: serine hydrolase domain-containing protein, partial [Bacillota bacterium]